MTEEELDVIIRRSNGRSVTVGRICSEDVVKLSELLYLLKTGRYDTSLSYLKSKCYDDNSLLDNDLQSAMRLLSEINFDDYILNMSRKPYLLSTGVYNLSHVADGLLCDESIIKLVSYTGKDRRHNAIGKGELAICCIFDNIINNYGPAGDLYNRITNNIIEVKSANGRLGAGNPKVNHEIFKELLLGDKNHKGVVLSKMAMTTHESMKNGFLDRFIKSMKFIYPNISEEYVRDVIIPGTDWTDESCVKKVLLKIYAHNYVETHEYEEFIFFSEDRMSFIYLSAEELIGPEGAIENGDIVNSRNGSLNNVYPQVKWIKKKKDMEYIETH